MTPETDEGATSSEPETLPRDPSPTGANAHEEAASPQGLIFSWMRKERADLWVVALYAAAVGVLSLVTPIAVQQLVTTLAFGTILQPFVVLAILVFVLLCAAGALGAMQRWVIEVLEQRLFVHFASALAARLEQGPLASQDLSGPVRASRFLDIAIVQKSVATLLTDGIGVVLNAGIGLVVLAFYHPFLLAFDVMLIVGGAILVWGLGRGAIPTSLAESKRKHAVAGSFIEMAGAGEAFVEGNARNEVDARVRAYVEARKAHFRVLLRQILGGFALQATASAVLLGVGGTLVVEGQLTLGQLVAAEIIVTMVVASFAKLGKHFEAYYDLVAALDKLEHLVEPAEPAAATAGEAS